MQKKRQTRFLRSQAPGVVFRSDDTTTYPNYTWPRAALTLEVPTILTLGQPQEPSVTSSYIRQTSLDTICLFFIYPPLPTCFTYPSIPHHTYHNHNHNHNPNPKQQSNNSCKYDNVTHGLELGTWNEINRDPLVENQIRYTRTRRG